MPTLTVELPALHTQQREVADHPARFRVLACGRRWGKTRLGAALCVKQALEGGRAWWVGPSYPVASVGWRQIKRLALQLPGAEARESERMVTMPGGGWVQVRSADNPDSLRGEGLDFVVMDECAFIKEDAWREALRPSLSDRQGRAMFISTPKGRNWFWREWVRGQQGGEYQSWQLPTTDNPFIDAAEVEAARETLPERTFRQEYLAEFLEDAGGVFRGVRARATALRVPPYAGDFVMGVDWAQQHDFTVITVMDALTRRMVDLDRFNKVDWHLQRERLTTMHRRWKCRAIIAERNSIGSPNIEALQREGLPVIAFDTTATSKPPLIESLVLAFERGEIAIFPDPVLVGELEAYERTVSAHTGRSSYSAPAGLHDDCVISLALALHGVTMPTLSIRWL